MRKMCFSEQNTCNKEGNEQCENQPSRYDPKKDNGNPHDNSNSNKDAGGFSNKDKLDPIKDNKSKKDNCLKNKNQMQGQC